MKITYEEMFELGCRLQDESSLHGATGAAKLAVAEVAKLLLVPMNAEELGLTGAMEGSYTCKAIDRMLASRLEAVTPKPVDPRVRTVKDVLIKQAQRFTTKSLEETTAAILAALDGAK